MKNQKIKIMRGLGLIFFTLIISYNSYAQFTSIPDPNFEQALIDLGIDSDGIINGQVLTSDIEPVTALDIKFKNINDLTGISDFASLEDLNIRGNQLTTLDTSENNLLKTLNCNSNPLNSINISNNLLLENLEMRGLHQLATIDLSNNINLVEINLIDSWVDSIDILNNINLKTFKAGGVSFSDIDFSNNILLEYIEVIGVHLNTLDVNTNVLLKELYCGNYGGDIGQVISLIDLRNNPNLEIFQAENLFLLEFLNAKNGNNSILTVELPCDFEGEPCELTELNCVTVDNAIAATNNQAPYSNWYIAADFFYSEDCSLKINDNNEQLFSIYPNPVNETLILNATNNIGKLKIQIYSTEGKLLNTQNLDFNQQTSIDVSNLSSGIYFLNVEDGNGNMTVKKFVKQ